MSEEQPEVAWEDRDEDFELSEPQEETDSRNVAVVDFDGLVLAPSDWTVGTIYEQIGKQIDLDPEFQRRNVWSTRAKSKFIESIFLGVPIPQILLSSKREARSSFLVLDGKQRLTTIREFLDGKYSNGRVFRLRGLTVLEDNLSGKDWQKIQKDEEWKDRFLNATLRTAVLKGWKNEAVLYEIFHRLNSGSVRLSPMELRMSLHPGEFLKYIIKWTEEMGPLHHLLLKSEPDPRMGDVELCVRFLGFSDGTIQYRGDLKAFLDNVSMTYNEAFDDEDFKDSVSMRLREMNDAIEAGMEVFGERKFCRKWLGSDYERRFNRAIFDVLIGALAVPEFRSWARENPTLVVQAYQQLCSTNHAFVRSIESTTKTTEATRTRYSAWYDAAGEISGIKLALPNIA